MNAKPLLNTFDNLEKSVKAKRVQESKEKQSEMKREYALSYIAKWQSFRDRKDLAIKRYVKVRNKMSMIQKLTGYCIAQQVFRKIWKAFAARVRKRLAYNKMMFLLKMQIGKTKRRVLKKGATMMSR